jgi:hypothetical protein
MDSGFRRSDEQKKYFIVIPVPISIGMNSSRNPDVVPAKAGNQYPKTGFQIKSGMTKL